MTATVRQARREEVDAIVAVHLEAFRGFFLSRLGRRFLRELYTAFMSAPSGVLLTAHRGAQLVGFAAGTSQPRRFFRQLLVARGWALLAAAIPAALRQPALVLPRLLRAVVYRGDSGTGEGALLSSLAVARAEKGQGTGAALVGHFCAAAAAAGVKHVYLLTDSTGNDAVIRFYEGLGFRLDSQLTRPGGRGMRRYVKSVP
jgi:ribosomal protein S18 acetylase RimI-like enzyme